MNEKLFRGKREDGKGWVQSGNIIQFLDDGIRTVYMPHFTDRCDAAHEEPYDNIISITCNGDSRFYSIIPETVGQFTGVFDSNNDRIFEGDIILHKSRYEDCDCLSVVKIGKYSQDGSGGEYSPVECYGVYAEIYWHSTPDWAFEDYEPIKDFEKTMSLLELSGEIEVIGNIYDNPSILKEGNKLW